MMSVSPFVSLLHGRKMTTQSTRPKAPINKQTNKCFSPTSSIPLRRPQVTIQPPLSFIYLLRPSSTQCRKYCLFLVQIENKKFLRLTFNLFFDVTQITSYFGAKMINCRIAKNNILKPPNYSSVLKCSPQTERTFKDVIKYIPSFSEMGVNLKRNHLENDFALLSSQ